MILNYINQINLCYVVEGMDKCVMTLLFHVMDQCYHI